MTKQRLIIKHELLCKTVEFKDVQKCNPNTMYFLRCSVLNYICKYKAEICTKYSVICKDDL